jgi:hypothetical protein
VKALNELIAKSHEVAEAGGLPRALLSLVPDKADERQSFWNLLSYAHNAGDIDLVANFASLQNGKEDADFFLTRQIFVETLPRLTTNCVGVARTVAHLVIAAAGDISASWPLQEFRSFLNQDDKRPAEILTAIEAEPTSLAFFYPLQQQRVSTRIVSISLKRSTD